ncbi:hypothetical protein [Paraburkholderia sp. BCC1886]|uniref:hypothetical protein n=1 Tax=Paraburkholderia sp. BCC1886 TaxID=2562670 RepID=UPI0011833585|nr:hypothetical protein [Paraburkholderia sp. BCC1886]
MSDQDKAVFAALKSHTLLDEVESLAISTASIAYQLAELHPERKVLLQSLHRQLHDNMVKLRARNGAGMPLFEAKGPVARKLSEAIQAMRFTFSDQFEELANQRLEAIQSCFHFAPTQDAEKLQALQELLAPLVGLVTGSVLDSTIAPDITGDTDLMTLASGFYMDRRPVVPQLLLILSRELSEDGVKAHAIIGGHGAGLYFYHPGEDQWAYADMTYTFDNLVTVLRAEAAPLLESMGFSLTPLDLDAAVEDITSVVHHVFDNEADLPKGKVPLLVVDTDYSEIIVQLGGGYVWVFKNTKGAYPQRSRILLKQMGAHVVSASLADFNEFTRQAIVKGVKQQLDKLVKMLPNAVDDTVIHATEQRETCNGTVTT